MTTHSVEGRTTCPSHAEAAVHAAAGGAWLVLADDGKGSQVATFYPPATSMDVLAHEGDEGLVFYPFDGQRRPSMWTVGAEKFEADLALAKEELLRLAAGLWGLSSVEGLSARVERNTVDRRGGWRCTASDGKFSACGGGCGADHLAAVRASIEHVRQHMRSTRDNFAKATAETEERLAGFRARIASIEAALAAEPAGAP